MGLDMYLEARKYVRKVDWNTTDETGEPVVLPDYQEVAKFFPAGADEFGDYSGAMVTLNIGYWRKANQIHNWFVTECAGGEDDCRPVYVPSIKLTELLAMVNAVLEDNADPASTLPTASGFFFGSTEYDEYYKHDLKRTKSILEKALALDENGDVSFYYQASW